MTKSDGVRLDLTKRKSNKKEVRDHHEKEQWGETSP